MSGNRLAGGRQDRSPENDRGSSRKRDCSIRRSDGSPCDSALSSCPGKLRTYRSACGCWIAHSQIKPRQMSWRGFLLSQNAWYWPKQGWSGAGRMTLPYRVAVGETVVCATRAALGSRGRLAVRVCDIACDGGRRCPAMDFAETGIDTAKPVGAKSTEVPAELLD